eukprot:763647-Hanusia_phi.AAC.4
MNREYLEQQAERQKLAEVRPRPRHFPLPTSLDCRASDLLADPRNTQWVAEEEEKSRGGVCWLDSSRGGGKGGDGRGRMCRETGS